MEYPILKLTSNPELHKAFSKPYVLHFHGECDNQTYQAYMNYVIQTMSQFMADRFTITQTVCLKLQDGIFILCKDNLDVSMMKEVASAMLQEATTFIDQKMRITFGYAKTMLMVEGRTIGILNSNKVGDEFLQSKEYKNSIIDTNSISRMRTGFYLLTYEEFIEKTNFSN